MNEKYSIIPGMLKTVKQIGKAFAIYMTVLLTQGVTFQSTLLNKKIESQEELNQIVSEEAKILGLDPKIIDAKYDGETTGARKNGKRYDLHLDDNFFKTRPVVRHELYHIKRGDCDRGSSSVLYYLFVAEPMAKLYATTGWRL